MSDKSTITPISLNAERQHYATTLLRQFKTDVTVDESFRSTQTKIKGRLSRVSQSSHFKQHARRETVTCHDHPGRSKSEQTIKVTDTSYFTQVISVVPDQPSIFASN